jgi:hypothetical protein
MFTCYLDELRFQRVNDTRESKRQWGTYEAIYELKII